MKNIFLIPFILLGFAASAQKDSTSGQFSFGMRSTISTFTDAQSVGLGSGGEFRIRITKHMNTEWYGDYINTNIQNLGYRHDGHIGWSVLFYLDKEPLSVGKVTPYILAGQCFDYTDVHADYKNVNMQRWSAAAAQGGFGITYNITSRFDFSALTQYMMHLGTNVETQVEHIDLGAPPIEGPAYLSVTKKSGASLDGHLLITFSVNYRLGKL
ncbi:MAG TPA: hypothetical protein VNG53_03810 [Bacteroidia bacterium]|nr:hypothetical protein [Bacteroidia bacterium]